MTPQQIDTVADLVRQALETPTLRLEDMASAKWTSHQTLDIIFGAEQKFGVEFSNLQMESVESFETLLKALTEALAAKG